MNAPGGGGDAGGSLPACVENVLVRTGHMRKRLTIEWRGGGNKKRNPALFTKDRTPISNELNK